MTQAELFREYLAQTVLACNVNTEVFDSNGEKIGEFEIESVGTSFSVQTWHSVMFSDGSFLRITHGLL